MDDGKTGGGGNEVAHDEEEGHGHFPKLLGIELLFLVTRGGSRRPIFCPVSVIISFCCSTGAPLTRTRWVPSTFSSHCPLSSNHAVD